MEEPRRFMLSERERTIASLLAAGMSVRQIAAAQRLPVMTVLTYRTRIGEKLGATCAADLCRMLREGRNNNAGGRTLSVASESVKVRRGDRTRKGCEESDAP